MIYKEDLLIGGNKKLRWRRIFGKIYGLKRIYEDKSQEKNVMKGDFNTKFSIHVCRYDDGKIK